jgi:hypothetical protein
VVFSDFLKCGLKGVSERPIFSSDRSFSATGAAAEKPRASTIDEEDVADAAGAKPMEHGRERGEALRRQPTGMVARAGVPCRLRARSQRLCVGGGFLFLQVRRPRSRASIPRRSKRQEPGAFGGVGLESMGGVRARARCGNEKTYALAHSLTGHCGLFFGGVKSRDEE